MEPKLLKLKSLFRAQTIDRSDVVEPQIGFKIIFCELTKQLKVKVIGARQLPTAYGNIKPQGYVVKIRVFPEKEKYETSVVRESWPTFNEEFSFTLHAISSKTLYDLFKGKFVSFTVYAILEDQFESTSSKPKSTLKRFLSFNDYEETIKTAKNRRSYRNSLSSRRTVGAATYNLDLKSFTQKTRDGSLATPDIWRSVKEITSGVQTESREGKKGAIELTLSYDISEDGKNDTVQVTVTKFRCSLQTMQEHEKCGGQLYIKITAFEYDDLMQKTKSDRFDPTISLKLESNTATLRTTVNNHNLEQVKILIRLISKNLIGKKILLGKIEIDRNSEIWKEIVATPSTPITKLINLE